MKISGFLRSAGGRFALIAAVGLVCGVILGRGTMPKVQADTEGAACSLATVAGATYGYVSSGTAGSVPFVETGLIAINRVGDVTTNDTYSLNGTSGTDSLTGTIEVSPNCSFTVSLSNSATLAGVLVGGGAEAYFIQTNPGLTISGTAHRLQSQSQF
jgi:hypothetical protein